MKRIIALVGMLALVGLANADTIVEIAPDGLSARVYDSTIGIEYKLMNIDNVTDFENNGAADSVWEVLLSNPAEGPDWTNAKLDSTVTPGLEFDCWDSGDQFGGFVPAYQSTDAFVGMQLGTSPGQFFLDPSGDGPLSLTPDQTWPSNGSATPARGPMKIGYFHTSTNDKGLVDAQNARIIIPDNEEGDLRILEVFGASALDATFQMAYDPATQTTYIVPEPAALALLTIGTLVFGRRR